MADHYCSQKFWWLTVEPERRSMMSCCAATATKIDLSWLESNTGRLFNTPDLVQEREQMLLNRPVASCEATCWSAERQGLPSRRTIYNSNVKTHTDVQATPRVVHVNLGSDCNLTCSYCCKQYSTAWLHDIQKSGAYFDDVRYTINASDKIVLKLGQTTIKNSNSYQTIVNEITKFQNVETTLITGGEPFLYNGLTDLVNNMPGSIDIVTGLGVKSERLRRILDTLSTDTVFTISAENVGAFYEFNRYGNTWDNFQRNLDMIAQKFSYKFSMVFSNLTAHGFDEFQTAYGTGRDLLSLCNDPDYLSATVLDLTSKQQLEKITYKYHDAEIKQTLGVSSTAEQKRNFQIFIQQFVERRNLTLDIFPEHFVNWINTTEDII